MAPVSTFSEKTKCFFVGPSIIALKNSDREARSTTGVPIMPNGLIGNPHRPDVTGGPTFVCQIMLPSVASSAYTLFDAVTAMIIGPCGPASI